MTTEIIFAIFLGPLLISAIARRLPHFIACLILIGLAVFTATSGSIIVALVLWLIALIVGFVALASKSRIEREKAMLEEMRKTRIAMERRGGPV